MTNLWTGPYGAYVKSDQVMFCPSAPKNTLTSHTDNRATQYGLAVNWTGSPNYTTVVTRLASEGGGSTVGTLLDSLPEPSRTGMIAETGNPTSSGYINNGYGSSIFAAARAYSTVGPDNPSRHLEGSNYAYADGHYS